MNRVPNIYISFAKSLRYYSSTIDKITVDKINLPRGIYAEATNDSVFKRIMGQEELRNSFLSAVIGQPVLASTPIDLMLNPKSDYLHLRKLLSDKSSTTLMNAFATKNLYKVVSSKTNIEDPVMTSYVKQLVERLPELKEAFPPEERDSELDLLCKTSTGETINVEIQVEPQNYWDIRILSHMCGIFNRQFPRGFKWNSLQKPSKRSNILNEIQPNESNESIDMVMKKGKDQEGTTEGESDQIFRVIGVSIFVYPPKAPNLVRNNIPWYNAVPWKRDELRRHYKLLEQKNPQIQRPGIEFFDYNLEALRSKHNEKLFTDNEKELQEWLDLFARAHLKTTNDIEKEVTLDPVKKAYELIKSTSLPEHIMAEYTAKVQKQYNISNYVTAVRDEGKEEGIQIANEETAKNLLELDTPIEVIKKVTKLSDEKINNLRLLFKDRKPST